MANLFNALIGKPFGSLRAAGVPEGIRMSGKKLLFAVMGMRPKPTGPLARYGASGAPWFVRADLFRDSPCLISAGLSDDILFEEEFLTLNDTATLLGFDPTPLCAPLMHELGERFSGRVSYRPAALGGKDDEQKVFAEIGPDGNAIYFYWSLPPGASEMKLVERTLEVVGIVSLLNDHAVPVDLLKIDIEGAEYALLEELGNARSLPRQLLIEFHYRFDSFSLSQTKSAIRRLAQLGYRMEWASDWHEEFLFVRHP